MADGSLQFGIAGPTEFFPEENAGESAAGTLFRLP